MFQAIYYSFYSVCFISLLSCEGKSLPKNGIPVVASDQHQSLTTINQATLKPENISCRINGKPWEATGFFGSHLFYSKGMSGMFNGKPFLSISFKATQLPDNRQLTINLIDFKGELKSYNSKDAEVNMWGSPSGDPSNVEIQGNRKHAKYSEFIVNITEWSLINLNEAMVSGSFEGTLDGLKMGVTHYSDLHITDGKFSKIKIQVYNDKY